MAARPKKREAPPDLDEFLRDYDPEVFPRPSVAVDLVVASVDADGRLLVLLVKRKERPFGGVWSLPGGFLRPDESVGDAAARVLREKTSLSDVTCEEIRSFSEPDRDPRTRVISIAHLALVPADRLDRVKAGGAAEDARFWVVSTGADGAPPELSSRAEGEPGPGPLAFDHDAILAAGIERLRSRVTSTTLAFGLLPERFTLSEAQRVVEAILGKRVDRAAFRTKVLTLGIVRPTAEERRGGAHRPAKLYVAAPGWEIAT